MGYKRGKVTPRDIVVPFIHVPSGAEAIKSSNITMFNAVSHSLKRETRTALELHSDVRINPSGVCEYSGELQKHHALYILNTMSALRKDAYGPIDRLFVTHPIKRVDVVKVLPDAFICERNPFLAYVQTTDQHQYDWYIRAALVLTTMHTIHTYFQYLRLVKEDEHFMEMVVVNNERSEEGNPNKYFKDNYLVTSAALYYPMQVMVSSVSLDLNMTNTNVFQYSFNARIDGYENKRALL